ncbi:hypothetical protein EJ05DRAFT_472902 [Pseudovirgaria hyperparasitica]|uniref:CsbD-like domain-containing protein n=1 Tax=Pseudovirgaria hyperparasitica TaxID=470096 RepID=A0A6A6WIJ2_9PEZI|nr:uncharacterized protein EJ05DRAFT_472902 [Pseudovirgaria hyperparasitica]KAF2761955.1 hypothetical protein EJ05DRAFT_472902 [Pseudovirgaria hyperparasitica]
MSNENQQPSLVASHANFISGAAKETVGQALGSTEWKQSGTAQKEHAVQDMKAAGEQRDPNKDGWGKAEEIAGKAAGCEGMEQEGAQSKK